MEGCHDKPMLCVAAANPLLYGRVPVLAHIRELRLRIEASTATLNAFPELRRRALAAAGARQYMLEGADFFASERTKASKQTNPNHPSSFPFHQTDNSTSFINRQQLYQQQREAWAEEQRKAKEAREAAEAAQNHQPMKLTDAARKVNPKS